MIPALVVALVASPVVLGLIGFVGDAWYPSGDWASLLYRTSRVGTADTPLVGPYSVKGYAHPGPFPFLVAAPFRWLAGGDARSLNWAAAAVNVASIAGIAAVAWRRGRAPLLLAVGLTLALLVHGLDPGRLVDIWNPYLGLLPFLLALLLTWDAALGRRWSLALAVVPASAATQSHLSFIALSVLAVAWLVAWVTLSPRLLGAAGGADDDGADDDGAGGSADEGADGGGAPAVPSWGRVVRVGLLVALVLWTLPLVDLVAGTHNLATVAGALVGGEGAQIGITYGGSLVSRYVRPDGPWVGGIEPEQLFSVRGSGPVPVVLVLGLLAGCLLVARRRGLRDAAALVSLAIVLTAGSILAAGNLVGPAFTYLMQFLKLVGAVVWLAVGWTAWRAAEPAVRSSPGRLRAAGALATVALVAATAWSWGDATSLEEPNAADAALVQDLRADLRTALPTGPTYVVDEVGDSLATIGAGVILWLIEDGYDVRTPDGSDGLKWGHEHLWEPGDPVDVALTVTVDTPADWIDPIGACAADPAVEPVVVHDDLRADERAELEALLAVPEEERSDADAARIAALSRRGVQVTIFAGDHLCAQDVEADFEAFIAENAG